ncbi:putative ring finger membrane protein [Phaeomoniella chlamydospora]|uniref:RING-type E3 ubiquitin transferase n=1 Tax=Phaeomoniella chlamydospora TaxID=158046 RepID=A0A0G2GQ87_PHACM|nr:putative ring finger membrane protein [Phaeomoniella chlamydospora]
MFPSFFRWTQRISADYAVNSSAEGRRVATILHRDTLLGEVNYLKVLTPSPTINNTVIDILEGQLVCLTLVVVTILLFLIREWVINQQPGNIPEMANADPLVNVQPVPVDDGVQAEIEEPSDGPPNPEPPFDTSHQGPNQPDNLAEETTLHDDSHSGQSDWNTVNDIDEIDEVGGDRDGPANENQSARTRPSLSGRNALDDASSIRRSIEEQSDTGLAWPGLDRFKDLWIRAGADPTRVLEIIEQENRQDELGWIVSQMEKLQKESRSSETSTDTVRNINIDEVQYSSPSQHVLAADGARPIRPSASNADETDQMSAAAPSQDWSFIRLTPESDVTTIDGDRVEGDTRVQEDPSAGVAAGNTEASDAQEQDSSAISSGNSPTLLEMPTPVGGILNWFWGNELYATAEDGADDVQHGNDHHVLQDAAQEAPFVPVQRGQQQPVEAPARNPLQDGALGARDPEVAAAAAEAGIDLNNIDAAEDLEDLDGVLELIGLQGPITGLLQNVIFSQFLISLTLLVGVGMPYVWGMMALHIVAHPISVFVKLPIVILTTVVDVVVDTSLFSAGIVLYSIFLLFSTIQRLFGLIVPPLGRVLSVAKATTASLTLVSRSGSRLEKTLGSLLIGDGMSLPRMSFSAHRSLRAMEEIFCRFSRSISDFVAPWIMDVPSEVESSAWPGIRQIVQQGVLKTVDLIHRCEGTILQTFNTIAGQLPTEDGATPPMYDQAEAQVELAWSARDKALAIGLGYAFIIFVGFSYTKFRKFLKPSKDDRADRILMEVIQQAGGVLKVILIIGIEMIVFPFYCGLLLDIALLPLFQDATLQSRIAFFSQSPMTALFVHWFVGTCYMFHFALFVSMCRKTIRKGVLYFIRDPEDPTFHPVRDVLERNVSTQLSKITFSALVYGGLVMVCLGGVVWSLSYLDGVLPIHWASGGPTLELPIDLIFYSFVLPVLLRNIQLSNKIDIVYKWWFRNVASWLRLSDFLFGERKEEELRPRTWMPRSLVRDELNNKDGNNDDDDLITTKDRQTDGHVPRDGKFVRTPASDSVRIPKGQRVFVEVNEENERVDGQPDKDDGPYGKKNKDFTVVFVPPKFGLRIALFIAHVWVFTAVLGMCITLLPLLIGRIIIAAISPFTTEPNDLYAFTLGCSIGLLIIYGISRLYNLWTQLNTHSLRSFPEAFSLAISTISHICGLIYLALFATFILPTALATLAELYIFLPIRTYISTAYDIPDVMHYPSHLLDPSDNPSHTIYLVQTWLLGILLTRVFLHFALTYPTDRTLLSTALKSIIRPPRYSIFSPNISLATRALVLPSSLLITILFSSPLLLGYLINSTPYFINQPPIIQEKVYRYSFPGVLTMGLCAWCVAALRTVMEKWQGKIRDEVYLVGERLHNLPEPSVGNGKGKGKGKERAVNTGNQEDRGSLGGREDIDGAAAGANGVRIAR